MMQRVSFSQTAKLMGLAYPGCLLLAQLAAARSGGYVANFRVQWWIDRAVILALAV